MTSLYLVRHAQARFGTGNYDRLSPLGVEQARLAGHWFASGREVIARVTTGTLQRQIDTGVAIAEQLKLLGRYTPQVTVDPRLDELAIDEHIERIVPLLPDPTGQIAADTANARQSARAYQKVIRHVFLHWQSMPAGAVGESWATFAARTRAALHSLICEAHSEEATIAVSSGAVIGTITQQVLGLAAEEVYGLFEVMKNCSITHLTHSRGRTTLSSYNNTNYLSMARAQNGGTLVTYR